MRSKRTRVEGEGSVDHTELEPAGDAMERDLVSDRPAEPEVKRRKSRPIKIEPGLVDSVVSEEKPETDFSTPVVPVSAGKVKNGNKIPAENGNTMKITGFNQEFEFEVNLSEPMQNLIRTIQPSLNFDLSKACIYLCGVQELTPATCLKNCVRDGSEGVVKVKLAVSYTQGQRPSINIEDVLQATQTPQVSAPSPAPVKRSPLGATVEHVSLGKKPNSRAKRASTSHRTSAAKRKAANDQNQEWVESDDFHALCRSNNIPQDVHDWSASDVAIWLGWAVQNFTLPDVDMRSWSEMDGNAVCSLGRDMFRELIGRDDRDLFWTHLEILRSKNHAEIPVHSVIPTVPSVALSSSKTRVRFPSKAAAVTNGSPFAKDSGSVQLWTFLLELLMSGQHANALEWTSSDGEFRLLDPERVAELWGLRKNKPSMNYEKMSRALRYYYDGNILAKVQGKHFTYKFLNNLSEHANKRMNDTAAQNQPLNLSPRASNPSSPMTPASVRSESELSVEVPLPQERKAAVAALDLRRLSGHSLSQVAA